MKQANSILLLSALIILAGCDSSPTQPGGLTISPGTATVQTGNALQFTVTDEDGALVTTGIEWSSSNQAAARVDANGMVTGRYANGSTSIIARTSTASATAEISTVPRVCFAIAQLDGEPDPATELQTFEVRFEPRIDPAQLAQELADRYGFKIDEITADGFVATLTPDQAANVLCEPDVARMIYQ